MDTRLAHMHQPAPGPRPKVKATILIDGIPVRVCESLEEMTVRLAHLRERGDRRAAGRILAAKMPDGAWAWTGKGHRHGGAE